MLESCNKVSWIGRAAFYCALLAIGSSIFCFLSLPIDKSGLYGYIAIGLFAVAFVLGFASLAAMLITRNFSGIIKTLLAIVLSVFPLLSVTMVEMSVRGRQKVAIVGSGRKTLETLDKALRNYERNNGHLPDANSWCDSLLEYDSALSEKSFIHPGAKVMELKGECHFAFNKNLSGVKLSDAASDTVLLFWADGAWNLNGGVELLEPEVNNNLGYMFITLANETTAIYHYKSKGYTIIHSKYNSKPKKLNWEP